MCAGTINTIFLWHSLSIRRKAQAMNCMVVLYQVCYSLTLSVSTNNYLSWLYIQQFCMARFWWKQYLPTHKESSYCHCNQLQSKFWPYPAWTSTSASIKYLLLWEVKKCILFLFCFLFFSFFNKITATIIQRFLFS